MPIERILVVTAEGHYLHVVRPFWEWLAIKGLLEEWRDTVDTYIEETEGGHREVYYNIDNSFEWDTTEQGLGYWSDLHEEYVEYQASHVDPPDPNRFKEVI